MTARPWFKIEKCEIFTDFFYRDSHPPSFYQLLIKSESRRGHFHKYANTRSHHHHHHHLCLVCHSGFLGLRVDNQELNLWCVSLTVLYSLYSGRYTLHVTSSLCLWSSLHTSAQWTFPAGVVLLKTSTHHFTLTGNVPVGQLCMLMLGREGRRGSNSLHTFGAHTITL